MFGTTLKTLRKQYNLTQSELAKKLRISASTIGMYEQNRRTPDNQTLSDLASFFNVSVDYLLGREDRHVNLPEICDKPFSALATFREAKGLTQQQLADKIGVNLTEYIAFENRIVKPSKDILNRLADELSAPPTLIWGTIELDDEDYQESLRIQQKHNDDKILEELIPILNRDSISELLRQVKGLPDYEIFKIINIIKALEYGETIPGVVIEEID